jgi:hypothetical protein
MPDQFTLRSDVGVWFDRFVGYATMLGLNGDDQVINLLKSLLDDETYKILANVGFARTWAEMQHKIETLFCKPKVSTHVYLHKFTKRVQQRGESVVQFATSLIELASKAFPYHPTQAVDTLLKEQFLFGLSNENMVNELRYANFRDFNALMYAAREFEASENGTEKLY